jgi:hypothetical protein
MPTSLVLAQEVEPCTALMDVIKVGAWGARKNLTRAAVAGQLRGAPVLALCRGAG